MSRNRTSRFAQSTLADTTPEATETEVETPVFDETPDFPEVPAETSAVCDPAPEPASVPAAEAGESDESTPDDEVSDEPAADEPSPLLSTIIDRLKTLLDAADSSGPCDTVPAPVSDWSVPRSPEVSETNYDEYELMERSWIGTVPAGLDLSGTSPGRL